MKFTKKYSFWNEIGGVFICNNCKRYFEQDYEKCPYCKLKMVGVQKEFKFYEKSEKDLKKDLTN